MTFLKRASAQLYVKFELDRFEGGGRVGACGQSAAESWMRALGLLGEAFCPFGIESFASVVGPAQKSLLPVPFLFRSRPGSLRFPKRSAELPHCCPGDAA